MSTRLLESIAVCLILLIIKDNVAAPAKGEKVCAKKADIIFVLDASSSIWGVHFNKQLDFVKSVIEEFNVYDDGTGTRLGAITYSDDYKVKVQFNLNSYFNRTELLKAISNIEQSRGQTYTHVALKAVREKMIKKTSGFRIDDPEVIKLVIVMTDGKSESPADTEKQATILQNVKPEIRMISVGIGSQVDGNELTVLASSPKENNTFTVDSFERLHAIKELLAVRACDVKVPEALPICELTKTSDIAFVLDSIITSDKDRTLNTMQFIKNITSELEIGPTKIQAALVPKDCTSLGFNFNEYKTRDDIHEHLDNVKLPLSTATRISMLDEDTFSSVSGAREGVRKIAVVLIEGPLDRNRLDVFRAARKARQAGIRIVAIGAGPNVSLKELRYISGNRHLAFHTDSYDTFDDVLEQSKALYSFICKGTVLPEVEKETS